LTAASFGDGRADIPAGLAGTAERVLVVGAGIAGLTVANALAHAGVECLVLKARDRAGGRLPGGCCSRGSTPRAHGCPTPTA
jgi:monoamine oxidase